jgi:hypothetical protein
MKINPIRSITLATSILLVLVFALLPAVSATSRLMTPYSDWNEDWGGRHLGGLSDYKYDDQACCIWVGTWYAPNNGYKIHCCVGVQTSKSGVGTVDTIRLYYDYCASFTYPPTRLPAASGWFLYIYDFADQEWDFKDWGETSGVASGYCDVDPSDGTYIQSTPTKYQVYIRLVVKTNHWLAYYFWIDQVNAKLIW